MEHGHRAHEERDADADDPRHLVREAGLLGRLDRELHAGAEGGEADQQRQVRVQVCLAGGDRPLDDRGIDIVEVEPPEGTGECEAKRRGGAGLETPAHAGRADDDREHALAEDDDREEADALRDVGAVNRDLADPLGARQRRPQVDRQRDGPDPVAVRRLYGRRDEEQRDAHAEGGDVDVEQGSRRGQVPPGARVQDDNHRADARVRQREARRGAVERVGDHRGEDGHGEHAGNHQDPVRRIVRVEAVGVERVADPRPPDGDEQPCEDEEAVDARVLAQPVGKLGDRDDEDEIEEELEPGRVALVPVVLERAEPRRIVPAGRRRHIR